MAIRRSNKEAARALARAQLEGELEALWVAVGAVMAHRRAAISYLDRSIKKRSHAERALSAAAVVGQVLSDVEQAEHIIENCHHLELLAVNMKEAVQVASGRALMVARAANVAVNELELPTVQRAVQLFAKDHVNQGTDGKQKQWRVLFNIAIAHGTGIEVFRLCDPSNGA